MTQETFQDQKDRQNFMEAAFELIPQVGWRSFSLLDAQEGGGLPAQRIYELFPKKSSLLNYFNRTIDARVLSRVTREDAQEPQRERLLDLILMRFEELTPYKPALHAIWHGSLCDPLSLLPSVPQGFLSIQWMLEMAGYDVQGPLGAFKVKGMALGYLNLLHQWFQDDTQDPSVLMALTDRLLTSLDSYLLSW